MVLQAFSLLGFESLKTNLRRLKPAVPASR
jgi:hypothetical protein